MEKTTKKRKKAKGMKKRIGIIAVGGLSLVLTICLSVGATLAWFAGSTWSSNQLYMGGPVYVEMAGSGAAGGTNADGSTSGAAKWKGGAGSLEIQAATTRTTGTVDTDGGTDGRQIPNNILLPGQKFEIYSQARVFSTAYTTSIGTNSNPSISSGANVNNTSINGEAHVTDKGRVTSTTTSVLRARFSISVEFDPTVGFNNFTDDSYADHYPAQSAAYTGDRQAGGNTELAWSAALGEEAYKTSTGSGQTPTYPEGSRRDAVPNTDELYTSVITADSPDLVAIRAGEKKSIYAWKFVSESVYTNENLTAAAPEDASAGIDCSSKNYLYAKMPSPFNGEDDTYGENGYYGVWILGAKDGSNKKYLTESDSFYKARCNSYIDSYVEEYITEYGEIKTRTIGDSLKSLENSLNQSFINLVNDASDNIIAGNVGGMTVSNGIMTYAEKPANYVTGSTNASWLYIDPTIGNDTNTNELSTSTGGWWYLVSGTGSVKAKSDQVATVTDSVTDTTTANQTNTPTPGEAFSRDAVDADDEDRLNAQLFEINPLVNLTAEELATNGTTEGKNKVTKVVSYSFPFVNGTSALPGDALTNVFANAKITIQISFQALQAFFPYSATIDDMEYTNTLLGTAKALNIKNAIPIFNEAFDYQENVSVDTITGL